MILNVIEVGQFRTRMSLQTPTMVRSLDGSYVVAWAELRKVWANFIALDNATRPMRETWSSEGTEKNFAGQQRSQQTHVISIRAQPENIDPSWRLVKIGTDNRVFNITEALLLQNVRKMVRIKAQENVSQPDNPNASGVLTRMQKTLSWGQIDFTLTQNLTFSIPSGYWFVPRSVSGFVNALTGSVVTQPTINVGIPSNHTKYLSGKTFTQLAAALNDQEFTQLLAAQGETQIWIEVATAGSVSSGGSYTGMFFVKGDQIG